MSLREAVLGIAQAMDEEAAQEASDLDGRWRSLLKSFARELRSAAKASEGVSDGGFGDVRAVLLQQEAEQAKREAARKAKMEESPVFAGALMATLVGGPSPGDMVQVGDVPRGAYMPLGNAVYKLSADGKELIYSEEQTKRYQDSRR